MARFFTSSFWALDGGSHAHGTTSKWSNEDMSPVPPHLRTWGTWAYVAYWISDATNVAVWQLASSMLAVGLSWRQAIAAIAVGHVIIAVVVVLNGTVGARLHIAFPVLNRSSFGFWLSYFTVLSRAILAMFWFGIQTFTGSECVYQMLRAIWPSIVHIPNHLPEKAHITTTGIMCYFIYWFIQFPFMFISPQKLRYLFHVKAVVVPAAWLSIFIWALVKVPPSTSLDSKHTLLSGSKLGWAWMSALNSALGIYATLAVNIPDFTRYAKTERAQYVQMIIIPIAFTFTSFMGIAVTSVGEVFYGETIWDPLRLVDRWDNRPATFFAAFSFALATIGSNISANSLSAANDLTVIWPRYINIRRGQAICAIIGGLALCPWEILATATGFLSFMNGYTVFLGPFAGIMVVDYWVLHRGKVDVPAMYDPHGRYRYWKGVNWRALLALLASVPPLLPGLISSINTSIHVSNGMRLFDIAWLYGFSMASFIYYITSKLFPAQETCLDAAVLWDHTSVSSPSIESDAKDSASDV